MFVLSNEAVPAAFEALRFNLSTVIFGSFMVLVALALIVTGIVHIRSSYKYKKYSSLVEQKEKVKADLYLESKSEIKVSDNLEELQKYTKKKDKYSDLKSDTFITLIIGGALLLIPGVIGFFPFDAKYWQAYQVVGTVEKIDTLASSDNNNVKLNSVLVLDNVDRPIYMGNEPLISTLEVGDTVNLLCTIEYSISINDKYHCVIKEWVEN